MRTGWAPLLALALGLSPACLAASPSPRPADTAPVGVALVVAGLPAQGGEVAGLNHQAVGRLFLAALRERGLGGVYGFVIGSEARDHPEDAVVLKEWVDAGQRLGNHTWSHLALDQATADQFARDVEANEKTLAALLPEREYKWFLYPNLSEGETRRKRSAVRKYLADHRYQVAQVTVDFQDWRWVEPYERCLAMKSAGKIALLKALYIKAAVERLRLARASSRLLFERETPQLLLVHFNAFTALMLGELLDALKLEGAAFEGFVTAMKDRALHAEPKAPSPVGKDLLSSLIEDRKLRYPPHEALPSVELESLCR